MRATRMIKDIEVKKKADLAVGTARHPQEDFQRHMAQLRSETIQARRLAEHILNLSREGMTQPRRAVMTDVLSIDPVCADRASSKSRASGNQLNFNPLHPSMELPPEQLIRLLGMEGKPARRQHTPRPIKAPAVSAGKPEHREISALTADSFSICASPEDGLPATRKRSAGAGVKTPRDKIRRTALLPSAIVVSVLAGLGLSFYVFWWSPPAGQSPVTQAPETTGAPVAKAVLSSGKTAVPATPSAALVTSPPTERQLPRAVDGPQWRAAVAVQEQRLRNAAEARFREDLQNTGSGIGNLRPTPPGQPAASVYSDTTPSASAAPGGAASNGIATVVDPVSNTVFEESGGLESSPMTENGAPQKEPSRQPVIAGDGDPLPPINPRDSTEPETSF